MRPNRSTSAAFDEAFRKGWRAATHDLVALAALLVAMAGVVGLYYLVPAAAALLSRYAAWQQSGGTLGNGVAAALAGGMLSEASLVYFQDRGRWSRRHAENLAFKMALFFVSGCIVYNFYLLQAYWWGQGHTPGVLIPKVLCDQLGYTLIFSAPYFTILTRWQVLRYSGRALQRELNMPFVFDRLLPMLVMNWMFWIPAVTLVYAMPFALQAPLYVFATAMWGLLVPALTRQESAAREVAAAPATDPTLVAGAMD